jgi:hypothetical protein
MPGPEGTQGSRAAEGPVPYRSALVTVTGVACLAVLAMIYLPPVQAKLAALGYPPGSFGLRYLAATLLGAAVGFAELTLRYRDEPLEAASSKPGLVFVLLNGTASTLALFMVEYFGARPPPPGGVMVQVSDTVQRVLISGLGAMFVLRGRLLSIAGPNDTRTDIGFAPLVEEILASVNRSIDRGRALERIALVTRLSREMAPLGFKDVAPFLKVGLQALQTLDPRLQKTVADNIDRLEKDASVGSAVKFEAVGYDLLNNFGERAFETLFIEARTSAVLSKADDDGTEAGCDTPQGGGDGPADMPQGGTAGEAPGDRAPPSERGG